MIRQSLNTPQGSVSVDKFTRHLWRDLKIGQIQPNQQFKIIWQSAQVIRPQPFPLWHSKKEWLQKMQALPSSGH